MRPRTFALWAATCAACAVGVVLLAGLVRSQSAPQSDPEREREREAAKQQKVEDAVRRAREGKFAVITVGTLRLGERELVQVTLEGLQGRRVVLVPCFEDRKAKKWSPPETLVKELKDVPRGYWEEIHLDEAYGIEWVVGVGASSPDSLKNLERQLAGRRWEAEKAGEPAAGEGEEEEAKQLKAVGRFVEMAQGTIEGAEARMLVVERGVAMTRTQFWLVDIDRNGKFVRPARNVLKVAESLQKGDNVEIQYTQFGDFYVINSLRVVNE